MKLYRGNEVHFRPAKTCSAVKTNYAKVEQTMLSLPRNATPLE
ncbi:MAG: hypothetical protein SAK29_21835 [Scytonema sp. PMC 1069.18]|nr:hypothetical protein [Scytonema sp. PMC 1069.18]MEC4885159.1 hypothetical protein [Scytonema sp. PMC 1070.18]